MSEAFKYTVNLTHVPSGRTVEFVNDWDYPGYKREEDWETDPVYLWAEGNYSCNCNRDLFFHRVSNPDYSHTGEDTNCKQYDDYRVNWIRNNETGNVIHEEVA